MKDNNMKIQVPFYKQTTNMNCGPFVLKIVFSFFKKQFPIELIEEKVGIKSGKAVSTLRLSIAAADLGFKAKIISKHIYFNEENLKLDFVKNYGAINLEVSKKLVKEAEEKGVELNEKEISLDDLLKYANENSIPIVLLDWSIIIGKPEKGYVGHFVPVVGYDEENIYVHNPNDDNGAFFKINKQVFDKARKATGTDEDILIISKNHNKI